MTELITRKGVYRPGEEITLCLRVENLRADRAEIVIWRLSQPWDRISLPVTDAATEIFLPPVAEDGACFGVEATLYVGGDAITTVATGVNIGGKVVRYGFLCDFSPEDGYDPTDVETLAAYHIDHVQFYDWSYRHDTLVAPMDEYTDMMGKRNSMPVIRQKIAACHACGMLTMAYGAAYAASRAFWETHKDWGLYAGPEKPMVFIDTFYYMNPDSPWREHLFAQYRDAVDIAGFDGIHMDTYGEPKRALSATGEQLDMEQSLPALLVDASNALQTARHAPHVIFNNVGCWPVAATRLVPQDAVYQELWPPMNRLCHLRQAVQNALPGGQPVVLAAYPAPFRTEEALRALTGERILSFAIALLGATQLFLGEKNAVVTQGYYADYTVLSETQRIVIKAYQDFFVRYQELFFDMSLKDVSLTHTGWDNQEYRCDEPFSVEGEADRLWLTIRENANRKLIGMINLCGCRNDGWNTGKETPVPLKNLVMHVLCCSPVATVWWATPDDGLGTPQPIACNSVECPLGWNVTFVVPLLEVAGIIWLDEPSVRTSTK